MLSRPPQALANAASDSAIVRTLVGGATFGSPRKARLTMATETPAAGRDILDRGVL